MKENNQYDILKQIVYNITKGEYPELIDDFFHDCYIILLEHPKYKSLETINDVKYFFSRIVLNLWRSNTSPTYKKYKRYMENKTEINEEITKVDTDYDYDTDMLIERVIGGLDMMLVSNNEKHRDMAILILEYFSNGENFTELSKVLGKDRSSLGKKYKRAINTLKEEYLDENDFIIPKGLSTKIINSNMLKKTEPVKKEETFDDWFIKNRVKVMNPKLFDTSERRKILDEYTKRYKVQMKLSCGNCFYKTLFHFKELLLK